MTNFAFLQTQPQYALFAPACTEAEKIYASAPAMCAVGCRKALELAVKWVYSADTSMEMPYKDNLQSLIHEPSFRNSVDVVVWKKLPFIVKLGNLAVHTERSVQKSDALTALKGLFDFVRWIDFCYGENYTERTFDENLIPKGTVVINVKKIKEQKSLLEEKEAEIEALRKKIAELSGRYTAEKEHHREERTFRVEDISEFETRKTYIDVDLKYLGWKFTGADADVQEEYPVEDMDNTPGQNGFVDYVLFGKDGLPLGVIEAKRTGKDPNTGRKQAVLYADALERKFGRRPMIFTTNGFETFFWDDTISPQRKVSGVFSKDDLQKLMNRRSEHAALTKVSISDAITDRYYQKEAIRAVCGQLEQGFRRHLLVMATGTGKTRTAASLVDVLSRGKWVTNILFLADRVALVKQAKDDFKQYLPEMSLCNLCSNKDDRNARIVFSTYPTVLNAIDDTCSPEGRQLFTPAHFDLIIIDESHRSIFKKYRAIFEYFDAVLVGLTATPKTDVDRNTYEFFEMEQNVPTYAYDYETAVKQDHVLVPYYNYEVKTKFLEEGIQYSELVAEDQPRYEADFTEDGEIPEFIPSEKLNKFIFNEITVDTVLQDLMEQGILVAGGDRIGKTIIFAQTKKHAEFILERFNKLYPRYKGTFAQRVICDDAYAQSIIEDFKIEEKEPHIVVSVDMMDTGIDVPACVNLVFFKKVRSKTKFWQMIGRGTRLCKDLSCIDQIDGAYTGKRRFLIFDYCSNFAYFREHEQGYETKEVKTLSENIFGKMVKIAAALQTSPYASDSCQNWRSEIIGVCRAQIAELNTQLISVKLKLKYVEKYRQPGPFICLTETDKGDLLTHIAPLVQNKDTDEWAKRFDNFMYGLILAFMEQLPACAAAQNQLKEIAAKLQQKISIPQIKEKLPLIQKIETDEFWKSNDILRFEEVRKNLRELIKFIDEKEGTERTIVTRLTDPVIDRQEGQTINDGYDFEDYRAKVNRYVNEHADSTAIYKLTHNVPLNRTDYKELERVLTKELGSKEDYRREFGDTPFGLLIRKIARLDHNAAMAAFSEFINDQALNQQQIAFVHKIISYIEQNGYMDSVSELTKPPFDKPVTFVKLFDTKTRSALIEILNRLKTNALHIAG